MSGAQKCASTTQKKNQGIVDGHPAGRQPSPRPVTLDTIVDRNATSESGPMQELPGVTSKDVYQSTGQPGSGMSSKELQHDSQPGRKKECLGLEAR
ncbi:hypothetical protein EDD18DRAFT_1224761 [Armillaria luteobubalina]|uniref:Uncharacterized protein n=1 Tax=Armillaria luteobubalina TaxID=153913 RepID=A0AA39NXE9_9AGAR|nr:hypothetical protein EDD18DRAFT_1224761 [Armillaria luteobubalina]